jgi:hypothetical protein
MTTAPHQQQRSRPGTPVNIIFSQPINEFGASEIILLCAAANVQLHHQYIQIHGLTGSQLLSFKTPSDVLIALDLDPRHYVECTRLLVAVRALQHAQKQSAVPARVAEKFSGQVELQKEVRLWQWLGERSDFAVLFEPFMTHRVSDAMFSAMDPYLASLALRVPAKTFLIAQLEYIALK